MRRGATTLWTGAAGCSGRPLIQLVACFQDNSFQLTISHSMEVWVVWEWRDQLPKEHCHWQRPAGQCCHWAGAFLPAQDLTWACFTLLSPWAIQIPRDLFHGLFLSLGFHIQSVLIHLGFVGMCVALKITGRHPQGGQQKRERGKIKRNLQHFWKWSCSVLHSVSVWVPAACDTPLSEWVAGKDPRLRAGDRVRHRSFPQLPWEKGCSGESHGPESGPEPLISGASSQQCCPSCSTTAQATAGTGALPSAPWAAHPLGEEKNPDPKDWGH